MTITEGEAWSFSLDASGVDVEKASQSREFATDIAAAEKIRETVIQGDPKLLNWDNQPVTREGRDL